MSRRKEAWGPRVWHQEVAQPLSDEKLTLHQYMVCSARHITCRDDTPFVFSCGPILDTSQVFWCEDYLLLARSIAVTTIYRYSLFSSLPKIILYLSCTFRTWSRMEWLLRALFFPHSQLAAVVSRCVVCVASSCLSGDYYGCYLPRSELFSRGPVCSWLLAMTAGAAVPYQYT